MSKQRTVRELHDDAMTLAQDAHVLMHNAMAMFREAADLERQAVERVRDLPDNEPTYAILRTSLQSLEMLADGKLEAARAMNDEPAP